MKFLGKDPGRRKVCPAVGVHKGHPGQRFTNKGEPRGSGALLSPSPPARRSSSMVREGEALNQSIKGNLIQ